MTIRHFITLDDISWDEAMELLERAKVFKKMRFGEPFQPLANKVLTMVFEKKSTRTRLSFEAGMLQLGGAAVYLNTSDTQLGRGEQLVDTIRVAGSMTDAVLIRTDEHERVEGLRQASAVPIINGLTDEFHPCQLLADAQTLYEHFGTLEDLTVAWIGDLNNMSRSYIQAARILRFTLNLCLPEELSGAVAEDRYVKVFNDPYQAVTGAQAVTTDVWASMGQEDTISERIALFSGYTVDDDLIAQAGHDAVFLHCLPAHRGEEVTASVIDGPRSLVWKQAENRLHSQKALLEWLLIPRR